MTLGGPKRFLLKDCKKKFHISGVAEQLENVSVRGSNTSAQVSGVHNLSTVGNYRIKETLERNSD